MFLYRHYIDKFLFALCRYAQDSGDKSAIDKAVVLVKQLHEPFFVPQKGYRWKINVDTSSIPSPTQIVPNHDAVSAWCVFSLINELSNGSLDNEVIDLTEIADSFFRQDLSSMLSGSTDELGCSTLLSYHSSVSAFLLLMY